jgi:hypothetical protein
MNEFLVWVIYGVVSLLFLFFIFNHYQKRGGDKLMDVKLKLIITRDPQVEELYFTSLEELKAKLLELGLIDAEGNPVTPPQA